MASWISLEIVSWRAADEYPNLGESRMYKDELDGAEVKELAIDRGVSWLNYSRRCERIRLLGSYEARASPGSGHGDRICGEGCPQVGGGSRENCI